MYVENIDFELQNGPQNGAKIIQKSTWTSIRKPTWLQSGLQSSSGPHFEPSRPPFYEKALHLCIAIAKILEKTRMFGIPEALRTHPKYSFIENVVFLLPYA